MIRLLCRVTSHSLWRNAIAAGVTQLSNFIPLLLTPFLAKRLGIEPFGVVAVVLSLIQLSFVITDFGYTLSTTHRVAKNSENRNEINRIISSVIIGKIPLTITAATGTLMFPWIATGYTDYWHLFAFASIAIIGQSYQMSWLFMGLEKMKVVTTYMVATKVLYMLFILLFVESPNDAGLVIIGWGIAQSSAALLSLLSTYKIGYRLERVNTEQILYETRTAYPFFVSRLAVASYTSAATALVGLIGQQEAAYFYASQQIYKIGAALPVNQVLYPYMARKKNWKVFYTVTAISGSILTIFAITSIFYAEGILSLLLGNDTSDAKPTLMIFLIATVISYFSVSFGYPALCAVNALQKANSSVIISAFVNLSILSLLYVTGTLSAFSTSIAILATEMCVLSLRIHYLIQAKHNAKHT